jgi:uncharacterized membrane protein
MEALHMVKSRFSYLLICLTLVLLLVGSFMSTMVSAQDDTLTPTPTPTSTPEETSTPTPTETSTPTPTLPVELKLKCDVPSYSDNSGASFNYTVNLSYSGNDTVTVNLSTTNPQGWKSYVTYTSKEVTSLPLGPLSYGSPDSKSLSVNFSPNTGNSPEPGEYKLTLKATAGEYSDTIELTAIVKAKYQFSMTTDNYNLATKAVAGKENHFSFYMNNTGTAVLENISLNVDKPEGWVVTFNPNKVESLGAGQSQQTDVVITPPEGKTVAGDYEITLRASNPQVSSSMKVRVTVETPSIWGVVSIGIIVVVIGGLATLFLKLGRR